MRELEGSAAVAVGIDAAVVANHHIVVRRPEAGRPGTVVDDFVVPPTLAGMERLTKRLASWPGAVAVVEPTSMTWLPLSIALRDAAVELSLVGNRHSARLRSALAGKNKSDPIDAAVLSRAGEFFELCPARIPDAAELALRRAAQRRGKAITDATRCLRRVVSQARWALPDLWNAFAGSRPTALAVLARWPHLDALARARVSSIIEVVAAHTRGVAECRATRPADPGDRPSVGRVLGQTPRPGRPRLGDRRAARRPRRRGHPGRPGHRPDPPLLGTALGRRPGAVVGAGHGSRAGPDRAGVPGRWQPSR
jgi:transposase